MKTKKEKIKEVAENLVDTIKSDLQNYTDLDIEINETHHFTDFEVINYSYKVKVSSRLIYSGDGYWTTDEFEYKLESINIESANLYNEDTGEDLDITKELQNEINL